MGHRKVMPYSPARAIPRRITIRSWSSLTARNKRGREIRKMHHHLVLESAQCRLAERLHLLSAYDHLQYFRNNDRELPAWQEPNARTTAKSTRRAYRPRFKSRNRSSYPGNYIYHVFALLAIGCCGRRL